MQATPEQHQQIAELYMEHHQWLLHWLRRRLHNACDAPDLLQSTFENILRKPLLLEQVQEPKAWLVTVAKNLVVDHQRRQLLEYSLQQTLANMPEAYAPSPEQQIMLLQALSSLDAMLADLGPKIRTTFLLARLDGLTYPEIASELGISLSSVEKYMAKATLHCLRYRLQHAPLD